MPHLQCFQLVSSLVDLQPPNCQKCAGGVKKKTLWSHQPVGLKVQIGQQFRIKKKKIPISFQPQTTTEAQVPLPRVRAGHHLEAAGVAQQFVQRVDDARELGPQVALLHPAFQHELVQHHGAVHGRGKPVVLLHRGHHLKDGFGQLYLSHLAYSPERDFRGNWPVVGMVVESQRRLGFFPPK